MAGDLEGADTKSVSVFVDSQGFGGWWSSGGTRQDGDPSREQPWLGNSSAASLVVLAKVNLLSFIVYFLLSSSFERLCDIKYFLLLLRATDSFLT